MSKIKFSSREVMVEKLPGIYDDSKFIVMYQDFLAHAGREVEISVFILIFMAIMEKHIGESFPEVRELLYGKRVELIDALVQDLGHAKMVKSFLLDP